MAFRTIEMPYAVSVKNRFFECVAPYLLLGIKRVGVKPDEGKSLRDILREFSGGKLEIRKKTAGEEVKPAGPEAQGAAISTGAEELYITNKSLCPLFQYGARVPKYRRRGFRNENSRLLIYLSNE